MVTTSDLGIAVGGGHLESLKLFANGLDRIEPFDAGHPIPAWQKKPKGVAMLGLQWLPVHLIDQHHFFAVGFFHVQAALVDLDLIPLDPLVGAGEDDVHRIVIEPGFIQYALQRSAGPFGVADRAEGPLIALCGWVKFTPAVSATFELQLIRVVGKVLLKIGNGEGFRMG